MQDIDRYRTIVRSYSGLQGLRIIPLGLLFLIFPLQLLDLPLLGAQGNCTITLPLFVVAIGSWFWIGKYYEKTYGKVEPLVDHRKQTATIVITLIAFIAVIVLENVLFRNHLGPPFNLMEFAAASAALYAGIKTRRWYYTLWGGLIGVASFLPLILGVGIGDAVFGDGGVVFDILFGLTIIMVGVLDHLRLARYFHPKGVGIDVRNP